MPFQLDIVTPEKTIFSDSVDDVYLPGSEGEMGILAMHAALVAPLQPGELRYLKDGKIEELAVGEGFVEVSDDKVAVLIDLAIGEDAIDESKVEEAMKRAQDALDGTSDDHEAMAALQVVIAKSEAMLRLKRKNR
ncbi:ATP synthase F1 subunit epsilon [Akkermansiaceae bacterium]|nr:ATP synthase F1 subunit epsilon [Akkermansiaceae bacterium]MDB4143035.1 ATP synthase F1 subunit epsilon [Akkermansiaceae bacterium]MDB4274360.1 ATP synthase F1 subunit epsilon [Akkermansiaceae bacterium]MDB4275900.1 ATP synthase F1 subunit epsilon [Akkermansiaceae bacterium]MDB4312877.1 ATP synthase F1 subunit epsilon [Akkermansiaceae bacterium]